MRYLKRAEVLYGKFKIRIHTKRYAGVTQIHLQPKIQAVKHLATRPAPAGTRKH